MASTLKQAALAAFTSLMQPVAHFMLRTGVSWQELAEALKLAYVNSASNEFGKHGRPANTSRVAILTGLNRKEVKRLRDLLMRGPSSSLPEMERINRASRVLGAWHQDSAFLTKSGKPRLLQFSGPNGFEELAKRYAPDIPPTAMLKELRQVGAVNDTASGKLRALARTFIPPGLDAEAVARFGSVIADIGHTIAHNHLTAPRRTRFERRATNLRVRRTAHPAFQRLLAERAMSLLTELDEWLTEHETVERNERSIRLGAGVYLIMDD